MELELYFQLMLPLMYQCDRFYVHWNTQAFDFNDGSLVVSHAFYYTFGNPN